MIKTKHRTIQDNFSVKDKLKINKKGYEPLSLHDMPIRWNKAKDYYVYDNEGNKWIDMTSGIFLTNSGHSNNKIFNAIRKQLDEELIYSYQYPTNIRDRFVEKLMDISPSYFEKLVLMNTGSEATDIAYKLIKLWGKKNKKKYIITFEGNYHGRTLGSELLGGTKNSASWSNIVDEDIIFLKFPFNPDEKFDLSVLPPADEICAFFLETYQGWGSWFYPQDYINSIYDLCKKNNILFCVDEVQAGFYRMGTLYGYMTYGKHIEPDLICVGKGLTSSLPMSAVLAKEDIIDVDESANLSGSHAGNTLCCAAGYANLEFLSDELFQKELKEKTKLFVQLNEKLNKFNIVDRVNVRGMVSGIITKDDNSATEITMKLVDKGILPVWTHRNSIKLGPPLTISKEAIIEAMNVIYNTIEEISSE